MPVSILATNAIEKSTYVITVAVTDEDDNPVTPSTMTWTLSDADGTTINSRADIVYTVDKGTGSGGTLASSMEIVLNGNDLAISDDSNTTERRILTIEGTYNSDAGTGLPYKSRCTFLVENLEVVT